MNITKGKINKPVRLVIYGPEGIGKSTFASKFPQPLFIDTEGSTNQLDIARMDSPTSWTMLLEEIKWVIGNPTVCKTLIIDTVDWAERYCIEHICSKHNKKGIEDFGYGNGYVYVAEEFGRFLNILTEVTNVGINIVLTAHAQIRKFEQPEEFGGYDHWELKLGKKTGSQTSPLVKEWADMLLFANYKIISVSVSDDGKKRKAQGGQRVMYTTHHPCWDAKNRFNLKEEIPFEYEEIAHLFNNDDNTKIDNTIEVETKPDDAVQEDLLAANVKFNEIKGFTDEEKSNVASLAYELKENNSKISWADAMELAQKQIEHNADKNKESKLLVNNKALNDLMLLNKVSVNEVQKVVGEKGYYPTNTPIDNYDEGFINGVLVGAWEQVFKMIKEMRGE